jgi:hypothetical protein
MTNEELIGVLVGTVGEEDEEAFNAAKAAVLARMATGEDAQRAAFMAGCKWKREMAATPSNAAP